MNPPSQRDPGRYRQEPTLGDGSRVPLYDHRPDRRPAGDGQVRRWRWWLLAGLALLAVLVIVFRGMLADRLMPQTRAQALIGQAAQALAEGRLTDADGSGARELYEAAVAIDPDRPEARAGLARVADAALVMARGAIAQDRFADAHAALRLARELAVPRADADAVADLLREREAAHAGIDGLLARAEASSMDGRLHGGENAALPLYARVLALQPGHPDALRGREDAIGVVLDGARDALRRGEVADAASAIALARQFDAGHVDLPDTQARLVEELEALRRRADADLSRGRIEQAVAAWQMLLQYDANDGDALAGLQRAAEAHAARARRHAADFRFAEADAALREAQALAPDNGGVRAAVAQVERSRRAHRSTGAPMPTAERARRVEALLQQASAAEARGDLLTPPGDSAYDKLRAAQALAPGDAGVRRAVGRLLPTARACFESGLSANDLGRARGCLDVREALGEDDANLSQARRRLAQRWLAIGDERLAGGQLQSARAALEAAQAIDPATPGIDPFAERLRTAAGNAQR
ncbi:hypothetical protein E2F46_15895 [Luteimonas aestuarii]|uniref:Tetratricopeptide repeat protein n=1 Tax=Luteimonas aestuarii TaxID=453837 RepID=A0A4R5TN13_9GAMM|nr:hypothetical protein [Luteimonas aestuarii]TDK20486.1 hypothetical protein E2F46_15895 [Luteimonas aestuarii]